MKITAHLLEACLKCATKCYLRSLSETGAGNDYAEWVRVQDESYQREAARRLQEGVPEAERVAGLSATENLKAAKWRLAMDVEISVPKAAHASPPEQLLGRTPGQPAEEASAPHSQAETLALRVGNGADRSADSHVRELEANNMTCGQGCPRSEDRGQGQQLESRLNAVERVPSEGRGKSAQFIPIRFVFRNKLTQDDRLLLAFDALVLSQVLGREVSLGKIIHGDDHATLKVKTSALFGEVRKRLEKISALLSSQTNTRSADSHVRKSEADGDETRGLGGPRSGSAPPDLVLNRHCAECEFQARWRKLAVEKDDLSLLAPWSRRFTEPGTWAGYSTGLAGMSAKERQKLCSKGIFTVTQLSYTFRPRRRPKRLRDKREKYHHSLKALAIREKKIHIVGSPELKIEGTPVYLDVEGLPDRDFYYLIGVRIGNGESAVSAAGDSLTNAELETGANFLPVASARL